MLAEPSDEQLHRFGEFFCRVLGSVYSTLREAEPVRLPEDICYPFYFGNAPSESLESGDAGALKLASLLTATVSPSVRCQRILRVFHGNMLLLVKPAQLRYWLRSIAVRDADELPDGLRVAGSWAARGWRVRAVGLARHRRGRIVLDARGERIDQLLRLEWKYLLPISIINVVIIGIIAVLELHF